MFPPKSVQLKKPFATRPWMGSEENVGNLLMVRLSYSYISLILQLENLITVNFFLSD